MLSNVYRLFESEGHKHLTQTRKETLCFVDVWETHEDGGRFMNGQIKAVSQTIEEVDCPFCVRDADRLPAIVRQRQLDRLGFPTVVAA